MHGHNPMSKPAGSIIWICAALSTFGLLLDFFAATSIWIIRIAENYTADGNYLGLVLLIWLICCAVLIFNAVQLFLHLFFGLAMRWLAHMLSRW